MESAKKSFGNELKKSSVEILIMLFVELVEASKNLNRATINDEKITADAV